MAPKLKSIPFYRLILKGIEVLGEQGLENGRWN